MTAFILVMATCGIVATLFLNWVFLALVGVIFVPVCVLTMVLLGMPALSALGQALLGYVVLQVAYGLAGWGSALFGNWRIRTRPRRDRTDLRPIVDDARPVKGGATGSERGYGDIHASTPAASIDRRPSMKAGPRHASTQPTRSGSTSEPFPLFGGWLPLAAFYDPPCHADGRPWNGQSDPGYRMTILVLGWFNRAVSVRVGSPKPWKPPVSQRERDSAVMTMDERVRRARAQAPEGTDGHPRDEGPDRT